ncbi:MAG TPA: 3-oxoacyl-ACP synthase [Planctomycetes bacterium]|nr:3-oxoacyl-ACP synthase [Planctomycetota bacterium]
MAVASFRGLGRTKRAAFTGTGAYLPARRMTNADLERMVDTSDAWIVQRTGIRERRIAAPEEATSDMALHAARAALADASLRAEDLDAIVVATMLGDRLVPSTAALVQAALGAPHAAAFDVGAACTGFVYALAVGASCVKSGLFRNVLVIGSECNSRIVDWTDRNTCILFGDGAGAAVLAAADGGEGSDILDVELGCDGAKAGLITIEAGGTRLPATPDTAAGGRHLLRMNGREVFKFAVNIMCHMLVDMCRRNGIALDDIALCIPHQVNYRVIEACCERVPLPLGRFYLNIDRCGNTSAASIPIALDEAVRAGRLARGDLVCILGFGAGMTWGSALVRW